VAVRTGALADSRLVARKLGEGTRVICASRGYLRRYGRPRTPAELARHRCLRMTSAGRLGEWWMRHDGGLGPSRDWLALGVAGLAPGFVELETSLYYGEGGRSALRLATQRDLMLTQRMILQPQLELAAYGRDDPQKQIGAGLANLAAGLRLRYEWRREFAPYVGVRWVNHFGDTAELRRAAGEKTDEWQWLAGVRAWF